MNPQRKSGSWPWSHWLIPIAILTGLMMGLYYYLARQKRPEQLTGRALDIEQFPGLTEAEAAERRLPTLQAELDQQARQVRRQIWLNSTFSIFNLSMIGLAIVQLILGAPASAIFSFFVFILHVIFNAGQQLYATRKVENLLDQAKPQATAIRESRLKSIGVEDIVEGDLLVAGPGDEFLANGQLVTGRVQVSGAHQARTGNEQNFKQVGDLIHSGDFCLEGRAIIRVTESPSKSAVMNWSPVQKKSELTPLQRIIARLLRLLLIIIIFSLVILFIDVAQVPFFRDLLIPKYRDAAVIFFSIAPSGLFFMIVATYALGSARLGELGALVHDSRSLESLAQITVLCFTKIGILTGADLYLDMIPQDNGRPVLPKSRVRQILGDVAYNALEDNLFLRAIAANLAGSQRKIKEAAGNFSVFGWSAVTFADADMRGTYFIGETEVLRPYLISSTPTDAEDGVETPIAERIRGLWADLGTLLSRNTPKSTDEAREQYAKNNEENDKTVPQPFLLFAYDPESVPLIDGSGRPQLPDDLMPICFIRIEESVPQEAREAINSFIDSGIRVKILSSEDQDTINNAVEQLGLVSDRSTLRSSFT